MKRKNLHNALTVAMLIGVPIAATSALAQPQHGSDSAMMGDHGVGWMGGGYGWMWLPILLVVVTAGLVAWFVAKKRK